MNTSSIWDQITVLVAAKTNRFAFSTWFKPVKLISDDGVALRVSVPNALFRDWFLTHYAPLVAQTLPELGRSGTIVSYVIDEGIRSVTTDSGVGAHGISGRPSRSLR